MPDDESPHLSDPAFHEWMDQKERGHAETEPTAKDWASWGYAESVSKQGKLSSMAEIPDHIKAKADAAVANVKKDITPAPVPQNAPVQDVKSVDDWRNAKHQERATARIEENKPQPAPDKGPDKG